MKVLICFPNNPCARAIAVRLLEAGHFVSIYCPNKVDIEKAQNMIDELQIIAAEQNRFRGEEDRFCMNRGDDLQSFDILAVPCVDVLNQKSDQLYTTMVKNLLTGIIAANEWGKIWPDSRKQIVVTCSIYLASLKINGVDSEERAFPVSRNPAKVVFTNDQTKEVKSLEGNWDLNSFPSLEQKAMWEVLHELTKCGNLENIDIVGRFPDDDESRKFNISKDSPIWLPTLIENVSWFTDFLPTLKSQWTLTRPEQLVPVPVSVVPFK